jgi:hypothetical protein
MGKLKKIAFTFLFLILSAGLLFLWNWAFYPVENIEITGKASATPQGVSSVIQVEDKYVVYPETWVINVDVSASNSFYKDITIKQVRYSIYLEDEKVVEGSFNNVDIDSTLRTPLPTITTYLNMKNSFEDKPHLIDNAVQNNGRLSLKVQVEFSTPAKFLDFIKIGTAIKSDEITVNLDLISSIRVSSFEWRSGYSKVNDCNPGDVLTSELSLWNYGYTGKNVETKIIEVSKDGSTKTLLTQEIDEELHTGYNTISVNWNVPESPPSDCMGYSLLLLYDGLELWGSQVNPPSLPLIKSISLLDAFTDEGIIITLGGRGYCSGDAITLKIKSELEVNIDLEVEPGTILINSGEGQNMILAEVNTVRLEPKIEVEFKIEAYCLDLHKDNPSSSELFTVSVDPSRYCPEAVDLMVSLKEVPWEYKSVSGIQLALWAVIEDPPRSEVELVFRVGESDLEDAVWLLNNIGVDTSQKRLFTED